MKTNKFFGIFIIFVFVLTIQSVAGTDFVNETKVIPSENIFSSGFSVSKKADVTVSINVTEGGPVDLLLMTSGNYSIYVDDFTNLHSNVFYYIIDGSSLSVKSKTYTVTLPIGEYYVVIENADFVSGGASSSGSVTAAILITYEASAPGFELPIFLFTILIIGFSLRILQKRK